MAYTLKVSEHTLFPGPRYKRLGQNSGEWFRDDVLIPIIEQYGEVTIDLDGTLGYGSSFLEESIAGLLRNNIDVRFVEYIAKTLKSDDLPDLKGEISGYVKDEMKRQGIQHIA